MAQRTYTSRVIVIKKTKLGESDLILTLLAEDGQQLRAVAKGARKPTSQFASRLELFSCADVLLAVGRNLDVVSEARLVEGNASLRSRYELSVAASPMVELLCQITDKGLTCPRLFPLTIAAFDALNSADGNAPSLVCSGYLLKAMSFSGFRPVFDACTICGNAIAPDAYGLVSLSYGEGGVVCAACARDAECVKVEHRLVEWAHQLLFSRFGDIASFHCDEGTEFQILQFCQQWIRYYVGRNLKSLTFMLAHGAF